MVSAVQNQIEATGDRRGSRQKDQHQREAGVPGVGAGKIAARLKLSGVRAHPNGDNGQTRFDCGG